MYSCLKRKFSFQRITQGQWRLLPKVLISGDLFIQWPAIIIVKGCKCGVPCVFLGVHICTSLYLEWWKVSELVSKNEKYWTFHPYEERIPHVTVEVHVITTLPNNRLLLLMIFIHVEYDTILEYIRFVLQVDKLPFPHLWIKNFRVTVSVTVTPAHQHNTALSVFLLDSSIYEENANTNILPGHDMTQIPFTMHPN